MKLNRKVVSLINEGFNAKTLKGFNDVQISQLYERVVKNKKKKENKEATTSTVTKTTYSSSEAKGKSFPGVTTVNQDGSVTVTKESEIKENDLNITNDPDATADGMGIFEKEIGESKKKKRKINPWAICTDSVGRKDKEKYERCVKDVKMKNKGNLDLGENKKVNKNLFIEEKILNLVQKYVEPKMTKKELISLIEGKKMDAPVTKPKEPTTKPGTKTPPKEKPLDPFKPSPHKNPKPKAKTKVPDWLSFNKLGIKFK